MEKRTDATLTTDQQFKEWDMKDLRAQEAIVSRLEDGPTSHLLNCTTAAEMWSKLLSVYEMKSQTTVYLLQQKFYNIKYEGEGMASFISKVQDVACQLKNMKEEISEKMIISKILMSLPSELCYFVSAWESTPQSNQGINELMARLQVEESRVQTREAPVAALNVQSDKQYKCYGCGRSGHFRNKCPEKRKAKNNLKCTNCQRRGHLVKDCRDLKQSNKESSASTAVVKANAFVSWALLNKEADPRSWYLDSGATEHMCSEIEKFHTYTEYKSERSVKIGDGSFLKSKGSGQVKVQAIVDSAVIETTMSNVLYVPRLVCNLFSKGAALDKGYTMFSDKNVSKIFNAEGDVCAIAKRNGNLYKMAFEEYPATGLLTVAKKESLRVWHERLAHQNFAHVKLFLKRENIEYEGDTEFCEACQMGKFKRSPFPRSESRSSIPGELIHADLCGPMVKSLGGSSYFLLLKDDYSQYRTIYFLRAKSEVSTKLSAFLQKVEVITGNKVKFLRSDNGGEFINNELEQLAESKGITHQKTVPYTPQQNGRAEREMRTIMEAARTMMLGKNLEKPFWAEAVNASVFTINRSGNSPVKGSTPYELWHKKSFDPSQLKIFGSEVFIHVPKEKRTKLDPKAKKGIFIGNSEEVKGLKVYLPEDNSTVFARDVVFVPETDKPMITEKVKERVEMFVEESEDEEVSEEDEADEEIDEPEQETDEEDPEQQEYNDEEPEQQVVDEDAPEDIRGLRPRRNIKRPAHLEDYDTSFFALDIDEPTSYAKAVAGRHGSEWKCAIDRELSALTENGTWEIVDKPRESEVIDSKFVFKVKRDQHGKVAQFKCRLVARGFQQKSVLEDIYSPVVKLSTIRVFFSVAVNQGWPLHQLDVCNAFLHGKLKEEIFMYLPEGCKMPKGKVCKLIKAIYGLKKAPLYWYTEFDKFMKGKGFQKAVSDVCLYIKTNGKNHFYVCVYVDDIVITGSDENQISILKLEMSKAFKIKDLGLLNYYLGMNIKQDIDNGTIHVNQKQYLKDLLLKFGMSECSSVNTPMESNFIAENLKYDQSESVEIENECRQIIGSIMYAMLGTRPDLCSSISLLSRYQNCASQNLLTSLKRVLRYIKGTLNLELVYRKNTKEIITGFADADWGGDTLDRKSTSGFMFFVLGGLVCWTSKKQPTVTISSTEAEYVALSLSITEACWLKNLIDELKLFPKVSKITIFEDNQSAIKLCKSNEQLKRIKHIEIKYHFVKEKVKSGLFDIVYVKTTDQLADILTKPLNNVPFKTIRKHLLL